MSKNKYHSRKITKDGETFDSAKEYRRWCELKLLERAGKIKIVGRQVKFTLIPSQKDKATKKVIERDCSYVADFVYWDGDKYIVEDTKGFKTKDYIIKRKLMLWVHGIRINEI